MATVEETLLTDLAHDGDLVKSSTGDLQTLSGMANLRDAIFCRMMTEPGSLVHRPDYGVGLKSFVNKLNTISNQQILLGRMEENFKRDPRIEQTLGLTVSYNEATPWLTELKVKIKTNRG